MSTTKLDVGMISATGTASSSTVLKGNGTWGAGGGWEFVSGATASGTAAVEFTGMASGYDYQVQAYDIVPASDNKDLYLQYGTGGTPTYQTSGYAYVVGGIVNTTKTAESSTSASQVRLLGQGGGKASNESYAISVTILNPADTGAETVFFGQGGGKTQGAEMLSQDIIGLRTTDEAVTAVKIYFSSSTNIATGKFFFYKRANA